MFIDIVVSGPEKYKKAFKKWRKKTKNVGNTTMRKEEFVIDKKVIDSLVYVSGGGTKKGGHKKGGGHRGRGGGGRRRKHDEAWMQVHWRPRSLWKDNPLDMTIFNYLKDDIETFSDKETYYEVEWAPSWVRQRDLK